MADRKNDRQKKPSKPFISAISDADHDLVFRSYGYKNVLLNILYKDEPVI